MPAILIKFKTEDGQEWTINEFAEAHQMAAFTVRNRWVRMGRPSELKYSDLLKAPGHGGQNALRITVTLRDCSERVCSAKEMGKLVDEEQGYHCDVVSHYDRWVRMGRPNPVHIDRLVQRKKAREKNELSHVPDGLCAGDDGGTTGRMGRGDPMTGTACAWCGQTIEIEVDAEHGGLCEACEEAVGTSDTAWKQQEEQCRKD